MKILFLLIIGIYNLLIQTKSLSNISIEYCGTNRRNDTIPTTYKKSSPIDSITIKDIQYALKSKGYSVKTNGRLDKRTKRALTSFRQKMGLPAHGEYELFRALGIIKE